MCGKLKETKRLCHIFNKTGKVKNLQEKISRTCGLLVEENDCLPELICGSCKTFVNKTYSFRQSCQEIQIELRQKVSIKRLRSSPGTNIEKKIRSSDPVRNQSESSSCKKMTFGDRPLLDKTNFINVACNSGNSSQINTFLSQLKLKRKDIKSVYDSEYDACHIAYYSVIIQK